MSQWNLIIHDLDNHSEIEKTKTFYYCYVYEYLKLLQHFLSSNIYNSIVFMPLHGNHTSLISDLLTLKLTHWPLGDLNEILDN